MEIITSDAEQKLSDYTASVTHDINDWRCVHIAFSAFEEAFVKKCSTVEEAMEQHRKTTMQLVKSALQEPLKNQKGKIFVCYDNDAFAIFLPTDDSILDQLRVLSEQFVSKDLKGMYQVYSLGQGMVDLTKLAREKAKLAAIKKLETADKRSRSEDEGLDLEVLEQKLQNRKHRTKDYILVVEDDELYATMLQSAFVPHYNVLTAATAKEATIKYLECAPDIVFLDIHLPDKSGIELLRQFREFDPNAHVVMLSADSVPKNVVDTRKLGAVGFITKPFSKDKILECLGKCPTLTRKHAA